MSYSYTCTLYKTVCLWVCLSVTLNAVTNCHRESKCTNQFWDNQGGLSCNCCTQRLVILHAQTPLANPDHTSKSRSPWACSLMICFVMHSACLSCEIVQLSIQATVPVQYLIIRWTIIVVKYKIFCFVFFCPLSLHDSTLAPVLFFSVDP